MFVQFDENALFQHTNGVATLNIDGQEIFFTRPTKTLWGPIIILIHGAGGSHLGWPKEIQRLAGTNVYNIDLPGHGKSYGPGRSTIEGYADVVQAFLEQLNLNDVTLVGHSMGGAIAQLLTIRQLPSIDKLILINSGARLRVSPKLMELISTEPEAAAELLEQMSWGSGTTDDLKQLSQTNIKQAKPATLHDDFSACDHFDIRMDLKRIDIPTLIIGGTDDRMTPMKYSEELASNIPGARLVIIEGAGHFAMLEKPEEVAAAMVAFL